MSGLFENKITGFKLTRAPSPIEMCEKIEFDLSNTHPSIMNILRYAVKTVPKKVLKLVTSGTDLNQYFVTDDPPYNYHDALDTSLSQLCLDQTVSLDNVYHINARASSTARRVVNTNDLLDVHGVKCPVQYHEFCEIGKDKSLQVNNIRVIMDRESFNSVCRFSFTKLEDTVDVLEACTKYHIVIEYNFGCNAIQLFRESITSLYDEIETGAVKVNTTQLYNQTVLALQVDQIVESLIALYMYRMFHVDARPGRYIDHQITVTGTRDDVLEKYHAATKAVLVDIMTFKTQVQ